MTITQQIAKHIREVHVGGNWTYSNLKDVLADVSWKDATTHVYSCNTIATLVYHIHYFIHVTLPVLQGGVLDGNDKLSFNHPPITSQEEWEQFLQMVWNEAESFAHLIEQLPDSILNEYLADPKYGNYFRNLHGIIEHSHYHLGQIVIIKKVIQQTSPM